MSAALAFAAILLLPGTARAAEYCGNIGGSYTSSSAIDVCLEDSWENSEPFAPRFQLYSSVLFWPAATSATGCKITVYARLDRPDTAVWNSAKVTRSCTEALGRFDSAENSHGASGTSAKTISLRGCVDLYYNGSSSSGWQRCYDTPWHTVPGS